MAEYNVFLKRSAEKELRMLPDQLHDRMVANLQNLKQNPRPPGVKKLSGRKGYRIRVGDYRVLFMIDDVSNKVEVYAIRHRRDVYR